MRDDQIGDSVRRRTQNRPNVERVCEHSVHRRLDGQPSRCIGGQHEDVVRLGPPDHEFILRRAGGAKRLQVKCRLGKFAQPETEVHKVGHQREGAAHVAIVRDAIGRARHDQIDSAVPIKIACCQVPRAPPGRQGLPGAKRAGALVGEYENLAVVRRSHGDVAQAIAREIGQRQSAQLAAAGAQMGRWPELASADCEVDRDRPIAVRHGNVRQGIAVQPAHGDVFGSIDDLAKAVAPGEGWVAHVEPGANRPQVVEQIGGRCRNGQRCE